MNKPTASKKSSLPRNAKISRRYRLASESDSSVRPWVRRVARATVFFYVVQTVGLLVPAYAQITPNGAAPASQRPIMDAANNGTPIVNIAPPSAAGVSRNQYNQFNVDPKGVILNNSRGNAQTQIGGWIAGNPQLGASPARIILNEVVSGNASILRGTIEVAGQKAGIVIANPNGVTCDGCGFLNTDRASLVAGTPQFGANGALNGFNVGDGQVNVGSQGLNAANIEQLDLIARGIVIEGEVWAKNLNAIAGTNQVLYGTLQSIAQNGSGNAPSFAIDIKELGGMYANQIYMVATEQGLGVNSIGRVAALQGNLTLAVNGDLALTDSYAKQNLQIEAKNITLKNKTIGDGTVQVAAVGSLNNLGIVFSGGDMEMRAAQLTDTKGKLMATRNLSIQADAIALNETTIAADGNATITAATGDLGADKVNLYAGGNLDIAAAGKIDNAGGTWQAAGDATLQANSIQNRASSILANQALSLSTSNGGLLDNQAGTLVGNTAVTLSGGEIQNAQGTIATDGTLHVDTNGAQLDNTDGNIHSGADATVSISSLNNTNGTVASGGNMALGIDGDYVNAGVLSSDKDMAISAANIANSGTIHAGKKLTANTGNVINDGELSAGNQLSSGELDPDSATTLNLSGTLTNTSTGLVDGSKTTINAATVNNTGRLYGDALTLQVDTLNNSGSGVVAARENLLLGARSIGNTDGGLIYSLGDIGIARSFDGAGQAVGEVETLLNASSKIEATGNIAIAAKDLVNRNDELVTRTETSSTAINKKQIQPLEGDLTKYDVAALGWSSKLGRGKGAYVHPSATYPFSKYGSEIRDAAYTRSCRDGDCNYEFRYANSDPIWALFGVTPGQNISSATALNTKIQAFNSNLTARAFDDWYEYTWTRKDVTDTVLASTRPAEILAGNALSIDASNSVLNDNSSLVAGGAINIVGANVENRGTQGTRTEKYVGSYAIRYVTRTTNDPELDWYPQGAITGAPIVTTTTLQAYTYKQNAASGITSRDLTSNAGSTPTAPLSTEALAQLSGQTQYRDWTVPNSSIFTTKTAPGARYLVETDPRFTGKTEFLSSDYYLNKLSSSPELQLKRYGDGFVEQKLVNDQILALTGRRYLSGYTSTESEYKGLMDAGVAFAQQYQISPGVTLSAEQMALLTTDIVLLIKQAVTLPDGSIQEVLVPQVYLRRPQAGDLLPSGGLIAGSDIYIKSAGDLVNTGQISADNENTLLAGKDLVNRDGRISGQDVYARAGNDLKNVSGTIQGDGANSIVTLSAGRDVVLETRTIAGQTVRSVTTAATSRVNADRIATVQGGTVTIDAGRDMIGKGSTVQADADLSVTAGRDLKVSAVETGYTWTEAASGRTTKGRQSYRTEESVKNELATFKAGGNVTLTAGDAGKGDVALNGVNITAGESVAVQGSNVTIEAVKDSELNDIQRVGKNSYRRSMRSDETIVGGQITAGDGIHVRATGASSLDANGVPTVTAGTGDVVVLGATLNATDGKVVVAANNNVIAGAMTTEHSTASEYYKKSHGFFTTTTKISNHFVDRTNAEVSALSSANDAVSIAAGGNVLLQGTKVDAKKDVTITAGNQLYGVAAYDTLSESKYDQKFKSGLHFSFSGYPIAPETKGKAYGKDVHATAAQGVNVASGGGNVTLFGGLAVGLEGAQLHANQGDVAIGGGTIDVRAAVDTINTNTTYIDKGNKMNLIALHKFAEGPGSVAKEKTSRQETILSRTTIDGDNIAITAIANDIHVAGTTIETPGTLALNAPNGTVAFDGQQTEITTSKTSEVKDIVYQKVKGKGGTEQITNYNVINAGDIAVGAPKITAKVGSKDSVAQLAAQPGMEWVNTLVNDPSFKDKVDWKKIEDASTHWDYKAQGLTPAGAIIVTIIVTWLTAGAGSGAAGGTAGGAAGGAAGGTAAGSAAASSALTTFVNGATSAALSALASQAAIAIINNQGDLGGALKDLGSSENIKGLLAAAVTGGVLARLNMPATGEPAVKGGAQTFTTQLRQNLQAGAAKAIINTAIYGGSLEENLKNSLLTAFVDTAAAQGANAIGDMNLDYVTNKLAHAIAGCAAGVAASGGSGCGAGAIGAAVGEIAAEGYGRKIDTVQFAAMVSGIAAAIAGLDADQIKTASQTGANAAANNYLTHEQATKKKSALAAATSDADKIKITDEYKKLDEAQREEATDCVVEKKCPNVMVGAAVQAALDGLVKACAIPQSCTADERSGIAELRGIYARVDAIKPDTTVEEFLIANKAVGAVFDLAKGAIVSLLARTEAKVAEASAQNIATVQKLAADLRLESAKSPFNPAGTLNPSAIDSARPIISSGSLGNPEIPAGFAKYATDVFQSPVGNFTVHFYKNPATGEVFYGLDYKVVFNKLSGVQ